MVYVRSSQNNESVTCSCVPNYFILFYDRNGQGGEFKFVKNDRF